MKVSNEELIRLLKLATKEPRSKDASNWLIPVVILFLTILAFLYENAGR